MTDEDIETVFKLANIWSGIDGRCNRPSQRSYRDYGARGIRLHPDWSGRQGQIRFVKWALANGWKPGLVFDRVDTNGHYGPDNVRCVTQKENSRNKSNNRLITFQGETKCVAAWGDDSRCVVPSNQFQQRIKCGWDIQRALTTPLRKQNRI